MNRVATVICALALVFSGCDCRTNVLTLTDCTGQSREPFRAGTGKAVVILFLMTDCPVAQATAPEIGRLVAEFGPRGVEFYGVYATEPAAEIAAYQNAYRLPFPGLLDPKQQLAALAGATIVPEAAVFSPDKRLLYRGRIDDRAVSPGKMRPEPTRHDLRLALEAVLAGQMTEPQFTQAVGCYLPER